MSGIRSIAGKAARPLWIAAGILSLLLGAIGAVLPVLPTTPFVLLAAFSFAKSAPRLALWLEEHKLFGPIIADWRRSGAIAPRYKALALTMMAAALGFSVYAGFSGLVIGIQAACIALAGAFILSRPNGDSTRG